MNDTKNNGSERVRQGHGVKKLGFKTSDGIEYETEWSLQSSDSLRTAYDVLRGVDGVERVWIDYTERSLDTDRSQNDNKDE